MSGSGREIFPNVRECSEGPPGCPGVFGSPHGWSGGPPECLGVFGRLSLVVGSFSRMSGSDWEAFPHVWVWSGGPTRCQGVIRRPSFMSKSDREVLPDVRE